MDVPSARETLEAYQPIPPTMVKSVTEKALPVKKQQMGGGGQSKKKPGKKSNSKMRLQFIINKESK